MVYELLVIGAVIIIVFGRYFNARASLIAEKARELEIDNDLKELK